MTIKVLNAVYYYTVWTVQNYTADANHLGRRKYYSNCTLICINFKSLQHRTFYGGM